MKIVFFINKKNGFAKSLIEYVENNFKDHEFDYYIIDRRMEEKLPELNNVHRILDYKEFLNNKQLRNNILHSDKIIVSGVFIMHAILPFFGKQVIRKTYLQFWGGDFYCFRNQSKANMVLKQFMNYCVRNCAGIVTLVDSEKNEFLKFFPYPNKKFFAVPVPNSPDEDALMTKYRDLAEKNFDPDCRRIVIGNSATKENHHAEVFDMLKHIAHEDIEIICPLSYGSAEYRDYVIAKGKEVFGDKFRPITDYMPYEDYMTLLSTCAVGVYNLDRQQGMGNISILVNMGKKVYIRSDVSLWDYYQSYQYKMNDIAVLEKQSAEEIFDWSEADRKGNHQALDQRNRKMLDIWTAIIND